MIWIKAKYGQTIRDEICVKIQDLLKNTASIFRLVNKISTNSLTGQLSIRRLNSFPNSIFATLAALLTLSILIMAAE